MSSQETYQLGLNIQTWRRLQGISASSMAARAGISRNTLANIEKGTGTVALANVFAVLDVLGIAGQLVAASHPAQTDLGRELIYRRAKNE